MDHKSSTFGSPNKNTSWNSDFTSLSYHALLTPTVHHCPTIYTSHPDCKSLSHHRLLIQTVHHCHTTNTSHMTVHHCPTTHFSLWLYITVLPLTSHSDCTSLTYHTRFSRRLYMTTYHTHFSLRLSRQSYQPSKTLSLLVRALPCAVTSRVLFAGSGLASPHKRRTNLRNGVRACIRN